MNITIQPAPNVTPTSLVSFWTQVWIVKANKKLSAGFDAWGLGYQSCLTGSTSGYHHDQFIKPIKMPGALDTNLVKLRQSIIIGIDI